MNEIIKIDSDSKVSGRELHDWLEVSEKFSDWMKRMIEYGFTAGIDFDSFSEKSDKPTGGRPSVGYRITIDMAKEICMIQRTDKVSRLDSISSNVNGDLSWQVFLMTVT